MKNDAVFEKTIFTDFFNTLVKRNKSPEEVIFDFSVLLGEKYSIEPAAIYKTFIKTKNALAVKSFCKSGEAEYSFSEIMAGVFEKLKGAAICGREKFFADAENLYIRAEFESFSINEKHAEKLRAAFQSGSDIIIISDFYCGKKFFEKWLELLGLADMFKDVFVSADYKKSKRTGALYIAALQKTGVSASEAVMYGDSMRSDVKNARRKGIRAEIVPALELKPIKDLKYRIKYGANALKTKEIYGENSRYSFSNFAFPLYLFTDRLYKELKSNGVKDVLFCSREGQFLKRLFDIYNEKKGDGSIKSRYFYVSRNSASVAALKPLPQEDFEKIINGVFLISADKVLSTLNFTESEKNVLKAQINENFDRNHTDFSKSKVFRELISNEYFKELYEKKRTAAKEGFKKYLNSFGIDFKSSGMTVVDIGWAGTIQDYIKKYIGGEYSLHGYYLGARDKTPIDMAEKTGLLYSAKSKKYNGSLFFHHHMAFYEQICRADHPHVSSYAPDGDGFAVLFGDEPDSGKIFEETIEPMQNMIAGKFEKLCALECYEYFSQLENTVMRANYRMMLTPSKEDYAWLIKAENTHYDSFVRVGYGFRKFKAGLRLALYGIENFFFRLKYGGFIAGRKVSLKQGKNPKNSKRNAAE